MIDVVLPSLTEISSELTKASAEVAGGSTGMPAAVDAGPGSSIVAALMGWACENAAGFCAALDDASTRVDTARTNYVAADAAAQDRFTRHGTAR